MANKLIETRNEKLRKNGAFAVLIFIFLAIFVAAFSLIGILWTALLLVVVPFFILPLCFSFQRAVIVMRDNDSTLSFRMIWEGIQVYFSERFSSTYSILKTALWGLLVYVVMLIITEITINLSFFYTNYLGFRDFFNEFMDAFNNLDMDAVNDVFNKYSEIVNIYQMWISFPPLVALTYYFLYFFSRNSVSLFLRSSALKYPGRYLLILHLETIKKNRGHFFLDYFRLNWPLYIIFSGGLVLGGYLGYLYQVNADVIFSFGLATALFLSFSLFGTVYFANKEALYLKYVDKYKETDQDLKNKFSQAVAARMEVLLKEQGKLGENAHIDVPDGMIEEEPSEEDNAEDK